MSDETVGPFLVIRDEVLGAWKNGTRVSKVGSEAGDTHADGAMATVLGSKHFGEKGLGYFVEWDDMPGIPVFIAAHRIRGVAPKPHRA